MIVWLYEWGGSLPYTSDYGWCTGAVVATPAVVFETLKRENSKIQWQERNDWQGSKSWWVGESNSAIGGIVYYRLRPAEVVGLTS